MRKWDKRRLLRSFASTVQPISNLKVRLHPTFLNTRIPPLSKLEVGCVPTLSLTIVAEIDRPRAEQYPERSLSLDQIRKSLPTQPVSLRPLFPGFLFLLCELFIPRKLLHTKYILRSLTLLFACRSHPTTLLPARIVPILAGFGRAIHARSSSSPSSKSLMVSE